MNVSNERKEEMTKLGADHFMAGKKLTPFECQEIDAILFAESKRDAAPSDCSMARACNRAKIYNALRGAFNDGWMRAYHASFN